MPMWASCRRASEAVATRPAFGFSLLELLVVLALLSFMTALVVPRLQTTLDAITRSGDRAEAVRQLERLPMLARRDGTPILRGPGQALALPGVELPGGWTVRVVETLQVAANGFCAPALLDVSSPDGEQRWALRSPDCRVSDAP